MGLVIKNVSKSYGDKKVVDNINLTIDKPGVYGLLGTNRSGENNYHSHVVRHFKKR